MPTAASTLVRTPSPVVPWRVSIRALWRCEHAEFRRHLLRLDGATRIERFGRNVRDDWVIRYADETDWLRGAVVGCWIEGTLRGIAELRRDGSGWSKTAEAALSIEPPFQNHGLGSLLAHRIVLVARNRGVATLHILFAAGNQRMRRIAQKQGACMAFAGDQIEADLALAPANTTTFAQEWFEQGAALLNASCRSTQFNALGWGAPIRK